MGRRHSSLVRRLPALRDPAARGGRLRRKPPRLPLRGLSAAPEATRSGGSSDRRSRRDLPPPAGSAEAEARAQCYAEGVREGRSLVQHRLDQAARIMEVFGLLGDFRLGLRVSKKTVQEDGGAGQG